MKRRQIIKYTVASGLSAIAAAWTSSSLSSSAQTPSNNALTVQWLGHTCFLFTGNGLRILVNPYRNIGCTAGYTLPDLEPDLVLISSQLFDEGAFGELPGQPRVLFEPGLFRLFGLEFQGIAIDHDHFGGRRYGTNIAWRWTQGGINILHLGGAAGKIELEQKILMGKPDLALIPVGAGEKVPKAYNPEQAIKAIKELDPKVVIPTHYLTEAADNNACDLVPVEEFLQLVSTNNIQRLDQDQITIKPEDLLGLPSTDIAIRILSDRNALTPAIVESP